LFTSGNIGADVDRLLYGFEFDLPDGISEITFVLNHKQTNAANVFNIDLVEIRICTPPITVPADIEVCFGTILTGTFNNNYNPSKPFYSGTNIQAK